MVGLVVRGQGELPRRRRGAAAAAVDRSGHRADVPRGARPPPQLRRGDRGLQDCLLRVDGQVPELPGDRAGELFQEEGEGDHLQMRAMRWHW